MFITEFVQFVVFGNPEVLNVPIIDTAAALFDKYKTESWRSSPECRKGRSEEYEDLNN